MPPIGENELDWLACIMGHGEGVDFQIANREGAMAIDQLHPWGLTAPLRCGGEGAVRHPDRQTMSGRQLVGSGNVIAVFVGDEYAGQVVRGKAEPAKFQDDLARAESTIEQKTGCTRFYEQGIAATAAAQRSEAHYFNWS
jgi:hypothetical protein